MKVGWIGLGRMGEAFALRILAEGHELIGHSRGSHKREELRAAGGRVTSSFIEVVSDADVVGVCLFNDAQVEEVLVGAGVLDAMPRGSVLALHTTGTPAFLEKLAARAPSAISVLDANFSGSTADAGRGQIRLFIGGDEAALAKARPVFSTYCSPILHLGQLGAGRRLKLINNILFAAQVSLAAEALSAVTKMNLPLEMAIEGLSLSSGRSFGIEIFKGGDIDSVLAHLAQFLDKDADAARAAARSEGLDLRLLDAAAAQWSLEKP